MEHSNSKSMSGWMDKNEVHLCGILAKDAEVKYTSTGKTVANIDLVTRYKNVPTYTRIVLWEERAERVAGLKKGQRIKVVGNLQVNSWAGQDGKKNYRTQVSAFQCVVQGQEGAITNTHGLEVSNEDIAF